MKKKLLFVIPLYGRQVSGGAEGHCRDIAERLVGEYDVEVATTKAKDFSTWANFFEEDEEVQNGVLIRRFEVDYLRNKRASHLEAMLLADQSNKELGRRWLEAQGPVSESLTSFIRGNSGDYHKIIVFQYLYALSYYAVQAAPAEKLIFVPLAHDEPILRLELFHEEFSKPEWIVYNTEAEKETVAKYHLTNKKSVTAGVGVEAPGGIDVNRFKEYFRLDRYIVFVGRIDRGKHVDVLVDNFIEYKRKYSNDLKLVLIGKEVTPVSQHKDVMLTGYLSTENKFAALGGSVALVNPSPYESLSLIVLESFLMKRPVLVNGFCEVLRRHAIEGNAGLWYESQEEFNHTLNYLLEHPQVADIMGQNGYEYVKDRYTWEIVMNKWREALDG